MAFLLKYLAGVVKNNNLIQNKQMGIIGVSIDKFNRCYYNTDNKIALLLRQYNQVLCAAEEARFNFKYVFPFYSL